MQIIVTVPFLDKKKKKLTAGYNCKVSVRHLGKVKVYQSPEGEALKVK